MEKIDQGKGNGWGEVAISNKLPPEGALRGLWEAVGTSWDFCRWGQVDPC